MKKPLIYIIPFFILLSCAGPKNSFERYYNQEIDNAKVALSFPKWLPMAFIPKQDKKEVKYFTEGMRKFKILVYDQKQTKSIESFSDFAKNKNFEKYFEVKKGKDLVNIYSKENEEEFKEIVLEFRSDEEHVVIGVLGNMNKAKFYEALKKLKEEED